MKILDKKIDELKQLLKNYEYDELSLRDLDYMDEHFEELLNEIRELKNDLVNDRFIKTLKDLESEIF